MALLLLRAISPVEEFIIFKVIFRQHEGNAKFQFGTGVKCPFRAPRCKAIIK